MAPKSSRRSTNRDSSQDLYKQILDLIYSAEDDGRPLSPIFEELPSREEYPDYYETIKRPFSLQMIQDNIKSKQYSDFKDFIFDVAQIFYNAKFYNSRISQVYTDALSLENQVKAEMQTMKENGLIEIDELPDIGPLPPASPGLENRPSDEEDVDDDEDDGDEGTGETKNQQKLNANGEVRRKRGRPPKVDTPTEARIKAILREMQKFRDQKGKSLFAPFEKLPDMQQHPDYYRLIPSPMALEVVRRKLKTRAYRDLSQFAEDMGIMFANARHFNDPDSNVHKDADYLESLLHEITSSVASKSDIEFANAERESNFPIKNVRVGRTPVTKIEYRGTIYEAGDFVHIQNPNDDHKPIPAQIFKTWQNPDGEYWVNACWYYRPEQTVHRADRTFYEHELVKTGQYRDHRIDEVIDKCFIMFITRYARGRPKDIQDREIYVCEYRYNEETKAFNRIKSWKSCLPDEVRNHDYDMYFFDRPQHLKRVLSPLLYLLPKGAKEDEFAPMPEPEMGKENAPPITGAIIPAPVPDIGKINAAGESAPPPVLQKQPSTASVPPPPPMPAPAAPLMHAFQSQNYMSTPNANFRTSSPITLPSRRPAAFTNDATRNIGQQHSGAAPSAYTLPIPYPTTPHGPIRPNPVPDATARHFLKDAYGRMLWFPVPPQEVIPPRPAGAADGLSLEYLLRRDDLIAKKKRKAEEMASQEADRNKKEKQEMEGTQRRVMQQLQDTFGVMSSRFEAELNTFIE